MGGLDARDDAVGRQSVYTIFLFDGIFLAPHLMIQLGLPIYYFGNRSSSSAGIFGPSRAMKNGSHAAISFHLLSFGEFLIYRETKLNLVHCWRKLST